MPKVYLCNFKNINSYMTQNMYFTRIKTPGWRNKPLLRNPGGRRDRQEMQQSDGHTTDYSRWNRRQTSVNSGSMHRASLSGKYCLYRIAGSTKRLHPDLTLILPRLCLSAACPDPYLNLDHRSLPWNCCVCSVNQSVQQTCCIWNWCVPNNQTR